MRVQSVENFMEEAVDRFVKAATVLLNISNSNEKFEATQTLANLNCTLQGVKVGVYILEERPLINQEQLIFLTFTLILDSLASQRPSTGNHVVQHCQQCVYQILVGLLSTSQPSNEALRRIVAIIESFSAVRQKFQQLCGELFLWDPPSQWPQLAPLIESSWLTSMDLNQKLLRSSLLCGLARETFWHLYFGPTKELKGTSNSRGAAWQTGRITASQRLILSQELVGFYIKLWQAFGSDLGSPTMTDLGIYVKDFLQLVQWAVPVFCSTNQCRAVEDTPWHILLEPQVLKHTSPQGLCDTLLEVSSALAVGKPKKLLLNRLSEEAQVNYLLITLRVMEALVSRTLSALSEKTSSDGPEGLYILYHWVPVFMVSLSSVSVKVGRLLAPQVWRLVGIMVSHPAYSASIAGITILRGLLQTSDSRAFLESLHTDKIRDMLLMLFIELIDLRGGDKSDSLVSIVNERADKAMSRLGCTCPCGWNDSLLMASMMDDDTFEEEEMRTFANRFVRFKEGLRMFITENTDNFKLMSLLQDSVTRFSASICGALEASSNPWRDPETADFDSVMKFEGPVSSQFAVVDVIGSLAEIFLSTIVLKESGLNLVQMVRRIQPPQRELESTWAVIENRRLELFVKAIQASGDDFIELKPILMERLTCVMNEQVRRLGGQTQIRRYAARAISMLVKGIPEIEELMRILGDHLLADQNKTSNTKFYAEQILQLAQKSNRRDICLGAARALAHNLLSYTLNKCASFRNDVNALKAWILGDISEIGTMQILDRQTDLVRAFDIMELMFIDLGLPDTWGAACDGGYLTNCNSSPTSDGLRTWNGMFCSPLSEVIGTLTESTIPFAIAFLSIWRTSDRVEGSFHDIVMGVGAHLLLQDQVTMNSEHLEKWCTTFKENLYRLGEVLSRLVGRILRLQLSTSLYGRVTITQPLQEILIHLTSRTTLADVPAKIKSAWVKSVLFSWPLYNMTQEVEHIDNWRRKQTFALCTREAVTYHKSLMQTVEQQAQALCDEILAEWTQTFELRKGMLRKCRSAAETEAWQTQYRRYLSHVTEYTLELARGLESVLRGPATEDGKVIENIERNTPLSALRNELGRYVGKELKNDFGLEDTIVAVALRYLDIPHSDAISAGHQILRLYLDSLAGLAARHAANQDLNQVTQLFEHRAKSLVAIFEKVMTSSCQPVMKDPFLFSEEDQNAFGQTMSMTAEAYILGMTVYDSPLKVYLRMPALSRDLVSGSLKVSNDIPLPPQSFWAHTNSTLFRLVQVLARIGVVCVPTGCSSPSAIISHAPPFVKSIFEQFVTQLRIESPEEFFEDLFVFQSQDRVQKARLKLREHMLIRLSTLLK